MKLFAFIFIALCVTLSLAAQTPQFTDPANLRGERVTPRDGRELPIDGGQGNAALGLQQLLRKLNTRASILNIVAHPDDEDGGMLTLYARGLGARVADLSLTRGEGGQNAMTADFEDALGLLRTQELLANDRYTGVDQMFGTEVDFGFSKTKEEAFAKWTHDRVLYDAVRAIRLYRPLVITSTWTGNVTDGHGQHQVSGQIAQEAFVAAADPKVFPDQIAEGILPWQALRVYARVPFADINAKGVFDYATGQYVAPHFVNYVTGKISTTKPPTDVVVPEGTSDPLFTAAAANPSDLPSNAAATPNTLLSYAQFSRIGLYLQRSQIGKDTRLPTAGIYNSGYTLYGSALCNDPTSARPPSISSRSCRIEQSQRAEGPTTKPVSPQTAASFSPGDLTAHPNFFTGIDISIEGIATLAPAAFPPNQLAEIAQAISTATNQFDPARPDAIAPMLAGGLKDIDQLIKVIQAWGGDPIQKANALHELLIKRLQLNDALSLALDLHFTATTASSELPANQSASATVSSTQSSDAANLVSAGAVSQHTTDANFSAVAEDRKPTCLLTSNSTDATLPYFHRDSIEDSIYQLRLPSWRNSPSGPPAFACIGVYSYHAAAIFLAAVARNGDQPVRFMPADTSRLHRIGYAGLPVANYIARPAKVVSRVNLTLPTHHNIAYLPGTGDAVPEALASINLTPSTLTVADLTPSNLAKYDTIILGVRTYAAHPDLHGAPTRALLDYARNGGNVVVQYQTTEFTAEDAPYPLSLGSNEKVVDETAPVSLLDPASPLLTTPNKITPADFNNWIEERGHGFLSTWDPHYTALTETHDPGAPSEYVAPQLPQRGGLITTTLGPQSGKQGRWTYVAFALYRQLPEAVPGAYRLFLNLLNPSH